MDINFLYILSAALAFALLGYYFWKDATDEGYSPIKIIDAYFLIVFMALIGGKLFFRPLSYEFFRYELLNTPLTLEGVLVGGTIGFIFMVKNYKWDIWKVGDTIASALAIFKSFLFLSFFIVNRDNWNLAVGILFFVLFAVIRFLKKEHSMGSSKDYFQLRRYKKTFFTGILLTIYLTWTSLVAILFLSLNPNINSGFWRVQLGFYLLVFASALYLFKIKTHQNKRTDYGK